MAKVPVTAVFDIGKTNKKFFLFDQHLQEVESSYTRIDPIPDEDGFASEALIPLQTWIMETFKEALHSEKFEVKRLNFSGHGASFVHLDAKGFPATPLYDYLKPYPEDLLDQFYQQYGGKMEFCKKTSSPPLAMLNSGLQLYFLKHHKPQQFAKIHSSLHLPQYLSYLFTGVQVSDYPSLGCHTGLWDFETMHYHEWVKNEACLSLLAPLRKGKTLLQTTTEFGCIPCGLGIHDSSAALLPYLAKEKDPFLLLSTGTWAISMHPFNTSPLTSQELRQDCLQFLSIEGQPIKISRLFIGEENKYQIESMYAHWQLPMGTYKKLVFDRGLYQKIASSPAPKIRMKYLQPEMFSIPNGEENTWDNFGSFEEAYYHFMHELTSLQVASLQLLLKDAPVRKIYVDGGFHANEIYLGMLGMKLPVCEFHASDFPNGSALGAAMLVNMAS